MDAIMWMWCYGHRILRLINPKSFNLNSITCLQRFVWKQITSTFVYNHKSIFVIRDQEVKHNQSLITSIIKHNRTNHQKRFQDERTKLQDFASINQISTINLKLSLRQLNLIRRLPVLRTLRQLNLFVFPFSAPLEFEALISEPKQNTISDLCEVSSRQIS